MFVISFSFPPLAPRWQEDGVIPYYIYRRGLYLIEPFLKSNLNF